MSLPLITIVRAHLVTFMVGKNRLEHPPRHPFKNTRTHGRVASAGAPDIMAAMVCGEVVTTTLREVGGTKIRNQTTPEGTKKTHV